MTSPSKNNIEPKNSWLVEVSPFPRGVFSGSMLVLGGVPNYEHATEKHVLKIACKMTASWKAAIC